MIEREKAINCLTDIENIMIARQDICPREELQYWIELQEGVADALVLLKEQEPVTPTWQEGKAFCGSCGLRIPMHRQKKKPYCPSCGRRVKWDGHQRY